MFTSRDKESDEEPGIEEEASYGKSIPIPHLWSAGRVTEPQFAQGGIWDGAGALCRGEVFPAVEALYCGRPAGSAGLLDARTTNPDIVDSGTPGPGTGDPRTADPGTTYLGTPDAGGVVIRAVVTAAPLLSTASEVQLLADPFKQSCHASGPELWQRFPLKHCNTAFDNFQSDILCYIWALHV